MTLLAALEILPRTTRGFSYRQSPSHHHHHRRAIWRTTSSKASRISGVTRLCAMDSKQLRFYGSDWYANFSSAATLGAPSFLPLSTTTVAADSPALLAAKPPSSSASSSSNKRNLSSKIPSQNEENDPLLNSPKQSYGPYIPLTREEQDLFRLLRKARKETNLSTTLRVAGGWVRDKLLATREFAQPHGADDKLQRLTSKYKPAAQASLGRQGTKVLSSASASNSKDDSDEDNHQPVDIDIALDDMLGREFADHLNEYLTQVGEDTISVGVVLKNPEKSKHLETATMKVGSFWIDFVNLRAEEYTEDSRIPDLMRIGTPHEDAFRRDLTINSLFYNINNGVVEDWTGRGFDDLRRGIVATPLAPLTTLLDDPLRTLRSVRFAARLRFTMDEALVEAAMDDRVRKSLSEKVSRERIGGEVDLMLRSPDPVGAMRLLINLKLVETVFPFEKCLPRDYVDATTFEKGLELLSTTHDYLTACKVEPPVWCEAKKCFKVNGDRELPLLEDEEARRLLWYSSFLKPLYDHSKSVPQEHRGQRAGKRANRSIISKLLVDELKRPSRDAEAVEKIMKGADEFTKLIQSGFDLTAVSILLSEIKICSEIKDSKEGNEESSSLLNCSMQGRTIHSATEDDPVWENAMDFRQKCARVLKKVGPLWRAAFFLSLSEQLEQLTHGEIEYAIEGDIVSILYIAML